LWREDWTRERAFLEPLIGMPLSYVGIEILVFPRRGIGRKSPFGLTNRVAVAA